MLNFIPRLLASLALGALLAFIPPLSDSDHGAAAWASTNLEGDWLARRSVGRGWWIRFEVGSRSHHSNGVDDPALEAFLDGGGLNHDVRRDAGSFLLTRTGGTADDGVRGTFRFTPDAGYVQAMASRGHVDLSDRKLYELAVLDLTTAFIDQLAALGYDDLELRQLIEMRIHDVDGAFVSQLAALGYSDLSARRLVEMAIHDVSPAFISELADAGIADLDASRLVEMSIHDVTPEFVRAMAAVGYEDLSPARLVEMKIHGVSPALVEELARAGIERPEPARLIELAIHDVTPRFLERMSELGYGGQPAERWVEARIHGVTPGVRGGAGAARLPGRSAAPAVAMRSTASLPATSTS